MNTIQSFTRYVLSGTLLVAAVFTGCDKVDGPYGTVNVSTVDTVAFPPPAFVLNYDEPRRILLEDFTGHTCGNCPNAATILENLIGNSGGKIIGVAIHAGETFAAPVPPKYPMDYRTELGTAIDNQFGITSAGQPNGMINRRKNGNVYYAIPNTWNSQTTALLNNSPEADAHVAVKAYFDAEKGKVIAYVNAGFLEPMNGTYRLAAFLIEDSVVGPQKWYNQGLPQDYEENYVFNHTLRGNISSLWGEDIVTDPQVGSVYRKLWSAKLKPEWDVTHMKVVAILYNKDTYEVVQPAEAYIE